MGVLPNLTADLASGQTIYYIRHLTFKVKSTEVQTLGELRMRDTVNGWAGLLASPASSSRRV